LSRPSSPPRAVEPQNNPVLTGLSWIPHSPNLPYGPAYSSSSSSSSHVENLDVRKKIHTKICMIGGNCLGWQLSWVAIVPGGNCPGWQLSRVPIVQGANCPRCQLSRVPIVQGGNSPGWQSSRVAIVRVAIVLEPCTSPLQRDILSSGLTQCIPIGEITVLKETNPSIPKSMDSYHISITTI
jgi:hypothetical protein